MEPHHQNVAEMMRESDEGDLDIRYFQAHTQIGLLANPGFREGNRWGCPTIGVEFPKGPHW